MKRVLLALLLLLGACGGEESTESNDIPEMDYWWLDVNDENPGTDVDAQLQDGRVDQPGTGEIDDDLWKPPENIDHKVPIDLDVQTTEKTGDDEVETKDEDEKPVGEGEIGAPCVTGADCIEFLCLTSPEGMKCSGACDNFANPCPPQMYCANYPGQVTLVCVPGMVNICRPCSSNIDCFSNGVDVGDKCITMGSKGSFCGGNCESGGSCPAGYECHGMSDIGGMPADQCIRVDQECECANQFIQEGAWTTCYNQNLFGKCEGDRFCTAIGLSACSAPIPTEEVCNGQDDNCNGEVDEGTPDSDGDGIPDCVDEDDDNDNISDFADNCPLDANPGQEDLDKDTQGDACDDDKDGDGDPNSTDCAPMEATIYHGAEELCDGIDTDCEGGGAGDEVDGDGDGLMGCEGDCNDANNQVYPGALESCATGYDDDCDGDANTPDAIGCQNYFADEDNDGYGTGEFECLCFPEAPYTAGNSFDCDDTDADIRPDTIEDCATALIDENCDGNLSMEGALNCSLFYKDADEDGYGVPQSVCACEPDGIYTADNVLDCNDSNSDVNPDEDEDCLTIGVDDNCNGTTNDMDAANCSPWFEDKDGDTFGVGMQVCICEPQSVYTSPNGDDCDDTNGLVFPGKKETCATNYDDNCNDESNEPDAEGCTPWWVDQDGDGYAGTLICLCEAPANAEDYPEDCCDADPNAHPDQNKYFSEPINWCGGYDYNCDGSDESQYNSSCVEPPCSAGWFQPTPECGSTGNWCLNCSGCGSCIGQTIQQKQKCR